MTTQAVRCHDSLALPGATYMPNLMKAEFPAGFSSIWQIAHTTFEGLKEHIDMSFGNARTGQLSCFETRESLWEELMKNNIV